MNNSNRPYYLILFVLALGVNFIGINNDFFSDDPGLYASIAKSMLYKHDLWQLYSYNVDWLDKPHFPFWAVYASFKLFGISVWAYRLPALLFFLLSLVYTYLFTRKYYTAESAFTAVLIIMTAQHVLISNVDVRAEPYLMGLITGSIYHIAKLYERCSLIDFLLAALLTACAIMTKGIFVIAAVYGALLGQLILDKNFRNLFTLKWWLLFLATFIFCLPELYALYIQFDIHPEKTVFGKQSVSGIKWFLWDSQFGRFLNSGPIRHKSGSIFFFIHTMLWAFAPWCMLFYYALYKNLKAIARKVKLNEYFSLSGGLLLLLLFSLSGFQLPFYTNAIFPLFAIVTAAVVHRHLSKAANIYFNVVQWIAIILLPILAIAIHIFSKPESSLWLITGGIVFTCIALTVVLKVENTKLKLFFLSCCAVLFANLYMNSTFFKLLTSYNGQIAAANFANERSNETKHLYSVDPANNVFQFYCKRPVDFIPLDRFKDVPTSQQSLFFFGQPGIDSLKKNNVSFKVIKTFINYPQENILPRFVNKETRPSTLDQVYLISR